jgi:NodT family efflux transporter outer membrane factor (OMF) lipoprotein
MIRQVIMLGLAGAALSACATAPVLAPSPAVPEKWLAATRETVPHDDAYWNAISTDEVLKGILRDAGAIADVEIAAARAREAQALLTASRASLFPSLGATAETSLTGASNTVGSASSSIGLALTAPLDVFGGNRARTGAAAARADAAEAELRQARLVARRSAGQLYATLRAAQANLDAAQRQTRDANDSLALAKTRTRAGLETGLAVAQAQSAADTARARIPAFAQAEAQARLGLEALLGALPGAFVNRLKPAVGATPASEKLFDAPAAVIARRPDVRAAEARLIASGLDARAARADRWPSLSLTAALSQTDATQGLAGGAASLGLGLVGTLFDFGRLEALAEAAGARQAAEAASFRRTVTYALSAVEREADRLAQARREADATRAAVASARLQSSLARTRYRSGLTSFLDVLVADRAQADAEIALANAEGRKIDAAVSLAAELGLGQEP